jgi:glutamyl-tRNA synthetase
MKKEKSGQIRVRFAPSPTGPFHIGNVRTALFNYLFAKKNNGKFILRIEDTDLERSKQEWTEQIIEELKWLGISWDEGPDIGGEYGPYKQTQRLDVYEKYLKQLLKENKAYYCFCTEEELEQKRQAQLARGEAPNYDGKCSKLSKKEIEESIKNKKPSVIRFRIPAKKIKFPDLIRGEVEFDMSFVGDIVIAKDLRTPLYNFAVVIDDYLMKITNVIRGEDHISNTAKQIAMQEALGFEPVKYAHLPLILNPDRTKLSKRKGDVAIIDYHEQGYLPEAIVNFLVLLGWNPGTEKEIFTLSELEKEFSLEKVQKAGAVFNVQKLDNINGHYIRGKPIEKLTELCLPYLIEAGLIEKFPAPRSLDDEAGNGDQKITATGEEITKLKLQEIVQAYKDRLKKLSEIAELTDFFFKDKINYNKEMMRWKEMKDTDVKEALLLLARRSLGEGGCDGILDKLDPEKGEWNIKKIEQVLQDGAGEFNKQKGYPEKNRGYLLWPLRVALSGKQASAGPFEIAYILGKQKTLKRIKEGINLF